VNVLSCQPAERIGQLGELVVTEIEHPETYQATDLLRQAGQRIIREHEALEVRPLPDLERDLPKLLLPQIHVPLAPNHELHVAARGHVASRGAAAPRTVNQKRASGQSRSPFFFALRCSGGRHDRFAVVSRRRR
jgi:hypothetical protein